MAGKIQGYSGYMPEPLYKKVIEQKKFTGLTIGHMMTEGLKLYLAQNPIVKKPLNKIKKKIVRI